MYLYTNICNIMGGCLLKMRRKAVERENVIYNYIMKEFVFTVISSLSHAFKTESEFQSEFLGFSVLFLKDY